VKAPPPFTQQFCAAIWKSERSRLFTKGMNTNGGATIVSAKAPPSPPHPMHAMHMHTHTTHKSIKQGKKKKKKNHSLCANLCCLKKRREIL